MNWRAVPLALVIARLLGDPAAARLSDTTVAAFGLTPQAIYRLRAWRHAGWRRRLCSIALPHSST